MQASTFLVILQVHVRWRVRNNDTALVHSEIFVGDLTHRAKMRCPTLACPVRNGKYGKYPGMLHIASKNRLYAKISSQNLGWWRVHLASKLLRFLALLHNTTFCVSWMKSPQQIVLALWDQFLQPAVHKRETHNVIKKTQSIVTAREPLWLFLGI